MINLPLPLHISLGAYQTSVFGFKNECDIELFHKNKDNFESIANIKTGYMKKTLGIPYGRKFTISINDKIYKAYYNEKDRFLIKCRGEKAYYGDRENGRFVISTNGRIIGELKGTKLVTEVSCSNNRIKIYHPVIQKEDDQLFQEKLKTSLFSSSNFAKVERIEENGLFQECEIPMVILVATLMTWEPC